MMIVMVSGPHLVGRVLTLLRRYPRLVLRNPFLINLCVSVSAVSWKFYVYRVSWRWEMNRFISMSLGFYRFMRVKETQYWPINWNWAQGFGQVVVTWAQELEI